MTITASHAFRAAFPARRAARSGVTLVELIVVVATLGIIASVTVLVMPKRSIALNDTPTRITNARTQALRTGMPVSVFVRLDSGVRVVTALPDGTVLADSAAHVRRLTGEIRRPDTTRANRLAPQAAP